jgi:serine/threonine-protein kinase
MTTPDRWTRVDALFQAALDLPEDARARFVSQECGQDPSVLHDVLELLEADRHAARFLEGSGASRIPTEREPGTRIGSYRLERLLGRGGMSAVYLAVRADGAFDRRVAVKVMEQAGVGVDWRKRFQVERQVLARLEHPLIARLLDGGTTEDGCPYLVMELVEGRTIDRYCREEMLAVRERVALLRKVCEAVAWAHRNLIVHRDLKPSNVLVGADGTVRLLDFGIAKLLEPAAFDLAVDDTRSQIRVMSPSYASPEQIAGGVITTATDVWTLGLLAYEVLTGRRPFGTAGSLAELEASRRVEPELPSRCAEATDPQQRRTVRGQLRGDLDTIVLKALRAEPERRYGTAEELGADLERYLAGQPVAARPDTFLYRAGKLVRRHAAAFSIAAIGSLVVVSLVIGLAFQAARLRAERDRAREAMNLLSYVLRQDPSKPGGELTLREAFQRGEPQIRRQLAGQPHLLSIMLGTMGGIYQDLGRYAEARPVFEEALQLARQAGELHELHGALLSLGVLEQTVGSSDRAETRFRESLEVARKEHGRSHPDVAGPMIELGALVLYQDKPKDTIDLLVPALQMLEGTTSEGHAQGRAYGRAMLSEAYRKLGRLDEAESTLRQAIAIATEYDLHPYVSVLHGHLARIAQDRGDLDRAAEGFVRALQGLEPELGADHPITATMRVGLCEVRRGQGDSAGALPLCRKAVADLRAARPDHPETRQAQELLSKVESDVVAAKHAAPKPRPGVSPE